MQENSIKKVVILGSSGLREDHSMANVLIASTYSDILQIELITSFYRIIFVRENTKINAHNEPVSIISLSSDNKITTSGLKYDLNNEKLKSFSHGISNEVNGDSFTVKAESTIVVFIGISSEKNWYNWWRHIWSYFRLCSKGIWKRMCNF